MQEREEARWVSWAIGPLTLLVLAAALYAFTLDDRLRPGELQGGDLITHQYAQVEGRPGNAPGYPLYTMGGWLWFHAGRLLLGPGANPISILASYSTFWALLALWLLYELVLELAGRREGTARAAAWLASAFLAVIYFFWYYAVTTEQYASAVAWTLAAFLLAFRWQRDRRSGYLFALALLAGIALAHMVTLVLALPALAWLVLREEPALLRRPRLLLGLVAAGVLPLLSYLFVYAAGEAHPEWRGVGLQAASTWDWFWSFVATRQGQDELTWSLRPFFSASFPSLIPRELTWPGLLGGLAGLLALAAGNPRPRGADATDREQPEQRERRRRRAAAIGVTLALYLAFCWVDRQGNWYQVIMPAYALLVACLGLFAAGLARARRPLWRLLVFAALLALVAWRGATSYPEANSRARAEEDGLAPGWAIAADNPPEGTAVYGTLADSAALDYVTRIWGVRPDLHAVTIEQARDLLDRAGSVAVTVQALPIVQTEVPGALNYSALGSALVLAAREPLPPPSQPGPWQATFSPALRLAGGGLQRNNVTSEITVLLLWQATAPIERDLSVSVRLLAGGIEIAQVDRQHPVNGAFPTSMWRPGEHVADAYPFPAGGGRKPDGVRVIVYYRNETGEFVNVNEATFRVEQGKQKE